jgi:F-type H+-transporting ATPase subunit a
MQVISELVSLNQPSASLTVNQGIAYISVAPQPIFKIFDRIIITNSVLTSLIVCIFIILLSVIVYYSMPKSVNDQSRGVRGVIYSIVDILTTSLYNLVKSYNQENKVNIFIYSLCGFYFLYIVFSSWFGLLPLVEQTTWLNFENQRVNIVRAPTTDLSSTVALSGLAFLIIQIQGFVTLKLGYIGKFFNFSNPLNFVVGLLELISELSKLLSFSFRLFGNIFAGEVMLLIVGQLSKVDLEVFGNKIGYLGIPFPILVIALEFLVAIIQAYVFISLFLVFSSLAKEKAH